jgi:hypothetical protein
MDPVRRTGHEGELAIYFVGRRLYVLHAFAPKGDASAGEFFYISKLVSSAIKAEGVAGYGLGRSEAICRRLPPGRPG